MPRPCVSSSADNDAASEPLYLLLDSTGSKLCGAGEWLVEKHGTKRRRSWRKLHIGVDASTGEIVAATLTTKDVDDASEVGSLLAQVEGPVASFTADGAYDQESIYDAMTRRDPGPAIIVLPRSTAALSETAETEPTQRDHHLQCTASALHGALTNSTYLDQIFANRVRTRPCRTSPLSHAPG